MKKNITPLLILLYVFALYGCSGKTPITLDDFKKTMISAGYTILDASRQFDSNIAASVTVAAKDDHRIEFFVLTSEENAAGSFASNKNRLEPLEGGNFTTSVKASNYSAYSLTTKDQFYMVSRVGHTMIYLRAPKEQKETVSKLVKSLGY